VVVLGFRVMLCKLKVSQKEKQFALESVRQHHNGDYLLLGMVLLDNVAPASLQHVAFCLRKGRCIGAFWVLAPNKSHHHIFDASMLLCWLALCFHLPQLPHANARALLFSNQFVLR